MNLRKETEWIQGVLLHPDDYTIAEQDRQRHQLLEDLRHRKLLDVQSQSVLESPEALDEGWARPIVWGYHEGLLGSLDAAAEIGALMEHSVRREEGD
jgi:hypothetical protein